MDFCALSSGSSGNCFYLGNSKEAILVDAGISCKQILDRMKLISLDPNKVKGIFVTHEHSDHKRGVDVFARQFQVPIFANKKTFQSSFFCSQDDLLHEIKNNKPVTIGNIEVVALTKSHAAADPVFFSVTNNKTVSVITDAGLACNKINKAISVSDALFLESNHDLDMLHNGKYPYYLKRWISGDDGHLSNLQAGLSLLEHANSKLKHIILSHLSINNNTPLAALSTINQLINERKDLKKKTSVSISYREKPTKVFEI